MGGVFFAQVRLKYMLYGMVYISTYPADALGGYALNQQVDLDCSKQFKKATKGWVLDRFWQGVFFFEQNRGVF